MKSLKLKRHIFLLNCSLATTLNQMPFVLRNYESEVWHRISRTTHQTLSYVPGKCSPHFRKAIQVHSLYKPGRVIEILL